MKRIDKICVVCKKTFQVIPSKSFIKGCSRECSRTFKVGRVPWNKGLVGYRAGKTHHWSGRNMSDENNPMWKGQQVSYRGLHLWVEKHLGKPHKCENCKKTKLAHRQYQWANKSGNYLRELTDWIRLCVKCHKAFDGYGTGEYGH